MQRIGRLLGTAAATARGRILGLGRGQIVAAVAGVIVVLLVGFMLFTAGWERPPITSVQSGYRGGGQATLFNPRKVAEQLADNQAPIAPVAANPNGPRASEVFENIKVLGDLSVSQFVRLMQGMSEWIAPEQGCSYCHANGNFASDALYTKRVARRMIQMTWQINDRWKKHVAEVGVTCYTCHRGQHVPAQSWADTNNDRKNEGMVVADNAQPPNKGMGFFSSLPSDSYPALLDQSGQIRVQGNQALPNGNRKSIKQAERTFALMIHMSNALGVNCGFCHNSRNFGGKSSSDANQQRALYGIHMVRDVNNHYISPLAPVFPAERKVNGKPYKVNCASCHQGVYKPLYGAQMLAAYPVLAEKPASGETHPPKPAQNKNRRVDAGADKGNTSASAAVAASPQPAVKRVSEAKTAKPSAAP